MSHPTQTLRDKVWSVLNNVWTGDSEEDLYIKTDAILDLVREALLSDEVIRQVERGTHFAPRVSSVIVTAALDAVTGEGGER